MYYLWKAKESTNNKLIVYITDYKEVLPDGRVKVNDSYMPGLELIFSSKKKDDCIVHAQKLMETK